MTTIRDVAQAAQVSSTTVSRVVNRDPSVHPALRRLVEDAVQQLGYRPNAAARSLRLVRTGTIGVVVSELGNPPFTAFVQGIEQTAGEQRVGLFLCDAQGSFAAQGAHLERLHEQRVDGVIIHPIGPYHEQVEPLRAGGIPVIVVGQRRPSCGQPEIVLEEYEASRAALRLLFELGHRRIALTLRVYDRPSLATATMPNRITAYREAHAEAGIAADPRLIVEISSRGAARARGLC